MDVLSVEACVQAVIGAYRDASKLVQRLKDKQKGSEEFILPEHLTKDFEDSLLLGCAAVQSQYDHDVRRFGETYARGDSTAREQMKDILINLQQAVISHLREVFMDEAALDLHALKETSDDCRVNATVCLGQLYQRMSTATAAMKQMSRPRADDPDKAQLPPSLAYSSSLSTHSSSGGLPYDVQSNTSYTTYSSRTAVAHERKLSGGLTPQRRISMNSAYSFSSEQPKVRTPGEDNVPALPLSIKRQISQNTIDTIANAARQIDPIREQVHQINPEPPAYHHEISKPVYTSDDKGQKFPPESNFYQPPQIDASPPMPPVSPPQLSPKVLGDVDITRQSPNAQIHELENKQVLESRPALERIAELHAPVGEETTNQGQTTQRQPVPLNPDYSTLEFVAATNSQSRPAPISLSSAPHVGYAEYSQHPSPNPQQYVQQSVPYGYHYHPTNQAQMSMTSPVSRPQTSATEAGTMPAPIEPFVLQQRVPTIPSTPRPLSIRSTGSNGSKLGSFAIRKGLPPGIADAIQKPSSSSIEAQFTGQPRYVKPAPLDINNIGQGTQVYSPTSPLGRQIDGLLESMTAASTSTSGSLEAKMRLTGVRTASPELQVSRSQLNIPGEANLAGFCKGAVRQQLGGRKKGFSLEYRRGPKGPEHYWRCNKCLFEGPASVSKALPSGGRGSAKVEKTFDNKVRRSEGGIKYRWNFLAKCHVSKKLKIDSDALNSADVFACYFCCAEGAAKGWLDHGMSTQLASLGTFGAKKVTPVNVTPTFQGVQAFMMHLETHRQPMRTPGLIVANELNCIIGRLAQDHEDFDLNLPPMGA